MCYVACQTFTDNTNIGEKPTKGRQMKICTLLAMVFLSFPVLTHADDPGQAVIETLKDQSPVVSGGKGIVIKDRVTDKPFCIYMKNGVLQSEPGNCVQ